MIKPLSDGSFSTSRCIMRPSSKPGRSHGTQPTSAPKISVVSSLLRRLAAIEMAALGCMWSTCLAGRKPCSGVSIELGRGFRLNVVCGK